MMLWFQEYEWEQLIPADFLTIMPNPRFNELTEPLKLPKEDYPVMYLEVFTAIREFIEFKKYDIKPWQWKKEYYNKDIRQLEMMDAMMGDAEVYKRAKEKANQAMKKIIADERAKQQSQSRSTNIRRGNIQ